MFTGVEKMCLECGTRDRNARLRVWWNYKWDQRPESEA